MDHPNNLLIIIVADSRALRSFLGSSGRYILALHFNGHLDS